MAGKSLVTTLDNQGEEELTNEATMSSANITSSPGTMMCACLTHVVLADRSRVPFVSFQRKRAALALPPTGWHGMLYKRVGSGVQPA
jgi:hypothetical protein